MESAVAREKEGIALRGGLREDVECPGQRTVDGAYAEAAVEGTERIADRKAVQQPVDGADPQWIAGGVDEQDETEVPGPGEDCSSWSRR